MPVTKTAGAEVFVGTLAESGALIVEATRVGDDTTLAGIARIVAEAQQREAPIQRTLDRLAGWLVPVMLALARWSSRSRTIGIAPLPSLSSLVRAR